MWLYAHLRRMMNWLSLYIITPLQKLIAEQLNFNELY